MKSHYKFSHTDLPHLQSIYFFLICRISKLDTVIQVQPRERFVHIIVSITKLPLNIVYYTISSPYQYSASKLMVVSNKGFLVSFLKICWESFRFEKCVKLFLWSSTWHYMAFSIFQNNCSANKNQCIFSSEFTLVLNLVSSVNFKIPGTVLLTILLT